MSTEPGLTQPTAKVGKLQRLGTRRLTRAHLALMRRSVVTANASSALESVCVALGKALGVSVTARSHLVDSRALPQRTLVRGSAFALFTLAGVDASAVVEVELGFLTQVIGRLAGTRPASVAVVQLTRVESAAFGYLGLVAVQALRQSAFLEGTFAPRLAGTTLSKTETVGFLEDVPHLCIEVELGLEDVHGVIRLLLPALALQSAVETLPPDPLPPLAGSVREARLTLSCFVGQSQLPAEDVQRLTQGDVVLLDGLRLDDGQLRGALRLATRAFDLHGELTTQGFSVTRALTRAFPQEKTMTRNLTHPGGLPVDVEVELARVSLPLSELACIQPGLVLSLHKNASDPVLIRVGDRVVARAELVEIDGEVGARILTLLP